LCNLKIIKIEFLLILKIDITQDTKRVVKYMTIESDLINENTNLKKNIEELNNVIKEKDIEIEKLKNEIILINKKDNINNLKINTNNDNGNIDLNNIFTHSQNNPIPSDITFNNFENIRKTFSHDITELVDTNVKLNDKIKILKEEKDIYRSKYENFKKEKINNCKNKVWMFISFLKFKKTEYYKNKKNVNKIKIDNININQNKGLKEGNNRHRFEDKTLPILERCNIVAYKYNEELKKNKNNKLEILEFISSEHKVIIRFNSNIAEQVDENDKEMWNEIFKFKIENGELSNKNKTQFKYKVIRCNQLYKLYEENLGKFQIYVNYIGRLNKNEWKQYLKDFDILYNETIKEQKLCKYKYKDGKICKRANCNVNHKSIK
jgi:hypothetical protein